MNQFPLDTVDSPSLIIEMLFDLKVRDVMSTSLVTAGKKTPLGEIQKSMKDNGITGVPIVEGRRLVGLVSMDDIIQALGEGRIDEAAEAAMTRNLIVLESDMPLSFAISYMEKYRFGRFPVLSKERELVGIITSRDIIVHLLIKMNAELEVLEEQRRLRELNPCYSLPTTSVGTPTDSGEPDHFPTEEPENTSAAPIRMEWHTRKFDFEEAGRASTDIKKLLRERFPDLPRKLLRRIAVASYELEMNQVVHSLGGRVSLLLSGEELIIRAEDRGPGIEDIEKALTEGWSTATEWVRSLGFGAGMGLPNTRRVADSFTIQSDPGGTRVEVRFSLTMGPEE